MTIVTFLVVEFRFSIYLMWSQFGDTCTCSALVLKLQTVQTRGAAVIKARKLSSAMSAAKAICDHLRDVWFGTKPVCCCKAIIYHLRTYVWHSIVTADFLWWLTCMHTWQGEWVSMGVASDGSYGIQKDIIYSVPVTIDQDRSWKIVPVRIQYSRSCLMVCTFLNYFLDS